MRDRIKQVKLQPLLFTAVLLAPMAANATTWYVAPVASGTADCSSWANACNSIATAKNKVTSNFDEIWVKAGVYSFSNQVYNDMPGTYALKIYGGFAGTETSTIFRDPAKNVVVFSADVDGVDSGKVGGVTPSYTNVLGTGTTRILAFYNTGVTATAPVNILDGVTMTGMNLKTTWAGGLLIQNAKAVVNNVKFIGNKGHAPAVYMASAFTSATLTDITFENNYSYDEAPASGNDINAGGAIYAEGANARLTCTDCTFKGNHAVTTGGAVSVTAGASVAITRAGFTSNVAETAAGGALYSNSSGVIDLLSVLFDSNQATAGNGGAVAVTAGELNVGSATFFGNTAGASNFGGGINLGGGTAKAMIKYSTFVSNTAGSKGGAINVNAGYPGEKPLLATSLILNNTAPTGSNISDMSQVVDAGYNIIGYGGTSGVAGAWSIAGTSQTPSEPDASKIVAQALADNGGKFKSLKLAKTSIAIDAIPNDLAASSVGTTPSNPFLSVAQAHGAMVSYDSYKAGRYYFDLSGTTFGTYVDDNGYVLVASADSSNLQAAPYAQVSTLTQHNDNILTSAIMAKFTTSEIDQVRISSDSNGGRGTFDGYSQDADVINSLRLFLTLKNPGSGGSWQVTSSSSAVNYLTGNSYAGGSLDSEIYKAEGQTGIFWQPSIPKEALVDPGTNQATINDALDLWVRSSAGYCDGVIGADQRNLPRPDYANPNDPNQYGDINDCDIGAFEWNDGYQLDCWEEDGQRPENSLSGGSASVCVSDLNSLTPKGLIDNFGYFDVKSLLAMLLLVVARSRKAWIRLLTTGFMNEAVQTRIRTRG